VAVGEEKNQFEQLEFDQLELNTEETKNFLRDVIGQYSINAQEDRPTGHTPSLTADFLANGPSDAGDAIWNAAMNRAKAAAYQE
jgi:hypothetical protein